jgi:hypothetical protein
MELFERRRYYFCSYCGTFRFIETPPVDGVQVLEQRATTFPCPLCGAPLSKSLLDEVYPVDHCERCRGLLMMRGTFADAPYDSQAITRSGARWSPEITAFFIVPFVATSTWYLLMLCTLAAANGRLRWRTDVVAMALGALIVGFPTTVVITLVLTVPVYLLVRRTGGVSLGSAAAGGGSIGLCAALLFWIVAREWTVLSPLRGVLIGVTTAIVWWYAAGKPSRASGNTT